MSTGQGRLGGGVLFGLLVICLPAAAQPPNIQLSGFEVIFDGSLLGGALLDTCNGVGCDPTSGGNLDRFEADRISTATFTQDGVQNVIAMGIDSTRVWADLQVDNIGPAVPVNPPGDLTGVLIGGGGSPFGFDLFTDDPPADEQPILRLEFDSVNFLLNNNTLVFATEATIVQQDLPFGMMFEDDRVSFAYTAVLPGFEGSPTTEFVSSTGTVNISARIPEPTTAMLLVLGMIGGTTLAVSRRSSRGFSKTDNSSGQAG